MFQAETWGGSNYNFNFYWHSTSAILYARQKKILPLYYAKKRILTKSCIVDFKVSFDIRNSSSFFQ